MGSVLPVPLSRCPVPVVPLSRCPVPVVPLSRSRCPVPVVPLSGCRAASHGEEEGYPKCLSCTGLKYQDTERSIPIGSMVLLYMVTCTINIPHFC